MMVQQQQRPVCVITIVQSAPPVFVETTQAEFRAVVQRLTGSSSADLNSNNHRKSRTLEYDNFTDATINLPSSQSAISSTESPITAPSSGRCSPRACAGVPISIATSENSDSPCDTPDDAAGWCVIVDADRDYNSSSSCNAALASCNKRIKVGMCCAHEREDGILTLNSIGEQQQLGGIDCHSIDPDVQESHISLLSNIIPGSSSLTCTPSIAAATPGIITSFPSLHARSPPALSAVSAADPPCAVISRSTGQLTAVSRDDDDGDDDDCPGRFYCDPASLPPLVDFMIPDDQQLELFPTSLYSSSTSPAGTIATSPASTIASSPPHPLYPHTAPWEILNSSFSWKDDDFLCV